jgi:hypothetical protein
MIIFAPYLLLVTAHVHPAAEPRLNVESSCRAAANLGEADGRSFRACLQDELEAKNELAKNWAVYRAETRSRCGAQVMIGGDPSYVELLECLEMDRLVRGLPRETQKGVDEMQFLPNASQGEVPQH